MSLPFQQLAATRQAKKSSSLNLVALMDIFTVLVFFLLFNVHEEQSTTLNTQHISSLPLSTQAIDQLKDNFDVQLLELPTKSQAYFSGQEVALTDDFKALTETMKRYCQIDDASCHVLAIETPPEMPYPFVNRFVELGRSVGFDNVYLVVTQK